MYFFDAFLNELFSMIFFQWSFLNELFWCVFQLFLLLVTVNDEEFRITVKEIMTLVEPNQVGQITAKVTNANNWHGYIKDDKDGESYIYNFVRHLKFSIKISIFDKIFAFWQKFRFLTKISIFHKIVDFLTKKWIKQLIERKHERYRERRKSAIWYCRNRT